MLAALAWGTAAEGQVGTSGRPVRPQDREQLERRVRAEMGRMMQRRLGLDSLQAARLSEVVQGFEGRRRELFAQEQATRRRVEAMLREARPDQGEARSLLARMADLRQQEARLFREEQDALLEVLAPVQVLQLQSLRQDLGQRIRALGPPPRRR
jgi:Spy/CpxP family protein refolding chaperone